MVKRLKICIFNTYHTPYHMLSMIKIRSFDTKGIWSITTPVSYASHADIERHPDVITFIKKNIGSGKYNIERVGPTGKTWHLIDQGLLPSNFERNAPFRGSEPCAYAP